MIFYKKFSLFFLCMLLAVTQSVSAECSNAIAPTTPGDDFIVHDDGTVTHKRTGLMWIRCVAGQIWDNETCTGAPEGYIWQEALQAADTHDFAGYNDWRLPNKNELASLVERQCYNPALNTAIFPLVPVDEYMPFLSSSPMPSLYGINGLFGVWVVDVINGDAYANPHDGSWDEGVTTTPAFARFVRDVQ